MKDFVLVRGESGVLYLYPRETWEWMSNTGNRINTHDLEFVLDHDDPEVLKQMQALVNKDIEVKL